MSPTLLCMLLYLTETAKKNQTGPVACHWCNNQINIIKYGKYQRYSHDGRERMDVQRYLCKHDKCRRKFSILAHPFLRISRFSLCLFRQLLQLVRQEQSRAKIARYLGMTWSSACRAVEKARLVMEWIEQELNTDPRWAPSSCVSAGRRWSDFIRMFAAKFYPRRYGFQLPTQYKYLL